MVAADPMEFAGFKPLVDVKCVTNGAGRRRAAAAVDTALRDFPAEAIVSTGFCGAVDPDLSIADVVVATSVSEGAKRFPTLQPQCARAHHTGVVATIDRVAQTAVEKSAIRRTGAAAVEMEAAGVAERANVHGLPFFCIRVVTDLAGEDLVNDFNAALREDGRFATMDILKGTLRNPFVRLPELVRLRNRCVRSARVLGDFIADCRF